MKASETLTAAARRLERDHRQWEKPSLGCCDALGWYRDTLESSNSYHYAVEYLLLMRPITNHSSEYWYGLPWETPASQERILALLFAAAIAESEGD